MVWTYMYIEQALNWIRYQCSIPTLYTEAQLEIGDKAVMKVKTQLEAHECLLVTLGEWGGQTGLLGHLLME